jgi:hypothetical protein
VGVSFPDVFDSVRDALGCIGSVFVVAPPREAGFNAVAELRVGNVLVRLVRDRGQDFLDLAPANNPDAYAYFGDVAVAMGWATAAEVHALREPRKSLDEVVVLCANAAALQEAFARENAAATRARIENAKAARGAALAAHLGWGIKKS